MAEKGKIAIWVAIIGAAATIIAAIIAKVGGFPPFGPSPTPTPIPDIPYAGRVIDKRDERAIKGAKVEVDTRGESQPYYTGNNGTFSVVLSPSVKSVHIRVTADGYTTFSGPVFPASRNTLEDIRLEPIEGESRVNLPEGMKLRDAIKFLAKQDEYGVSYVGNCDLKLMQAKVQGGSYRGKDMGDIVGQLKNRLVNPPAGSSYDVTKIEDRKVYQIACSQ